MHPMDHGLPYFAVAVVVLVWAAPADAQVTCTWTDNPIIAGQTAIKAEHINEIRECIDRILAAGGTIPDPGRGDVDPTSVLDCPYSLDGDGFRVCYADGYEADAQFVSGVLDSAAGRLRQRFGPTSTPVDIYLFPAPGDVHGLTIQPGAALSYGGPQHLAIYLMARSAPAMRGACCTSLGLQFTDEAYQRTVLVHELSTAFMHHSPGYSKWAGWFVQGLQQYEGLVASGTLWRRAAERVWQDGSVSCAGGQLNVTELYWAGAIMLRYFADRFGERSHIRILESTHATLAEAIADELPPDESACALVDNWRAWMRDRYDL